MKNSKLIIISGCVFIVLIVSMIFLYKYICTSTFLVSNVETLDEATVKWTPTRVQVSLEGNPTTGYEWVQINNSNGVTCSDYRFECDNQGGLVGVPGTYVYEYDVSSDDCQTILVYNYKRNWEDSAAETVTVNILIKDAQIERVILLK